MFENTKVTKDKKGPFTYLFAGQIEILVGLLFGWDAVKWTTFCSIESCCDKKVTTEFFWLVSKDLTVFVTLSRSFESNVHKLGKLYHNLFDGK